MFSYYEQASWNKYDWLLFKSANFFLKIWFYSNLYFSFFSNKNFQSFDFRSIRLKKFVELAWKSTTLQKYKNFLVSYFEARVCALSWRLCTIYSHFEYFKDVIKNTVSNIIIPLVFSFLIESFSFNKIKYRFLSILEHFGKHLYKIFYLKK